MNVYLGQRTGWLVRSAFSKSDRKSYPISLFGIYWQVSSYVATKRRKQWGWPKTPCRSCMSE